MSVDIKRLRALEREANKAPWHTPYFESGDIRDSDYKWVCDVNGQGTTSEFIVEMRNVFPALLDEIERLTPVQRPMTLGEVQEHCKDELNRPLWKEEREPDKYIDSHWVDCTDLDQWTNKRKLVTHLYDVDWRCWHDRPTAEQSAQFPWEETT